MTHQHLPLPSTQIVKKSTQPTMRFLYPLAAIAVAVVFMTPSKGDVQVAREAGTTYTVVVEAT